MINIKKQSLYIVEKPKNMKAVQKHLKNILKNKQNKIHLAIQ